MKSLFFCTVSLCILMACKSEEKNVSGCVAVDMRKALATENSISLKDEIAGIEYIRLETNDSCLASRILDLQITNDYIFAFQVRGVGAIYQFDRNGKFIRQVSSIGNGPGEVSDILSLGVNEGARELYVFQSHNNTQCFSFDGEFLRSDIELRNVSGVKYFADGSSALKGRVLSPFAESPWAGALWGKDGKTIVTQSVFTQPVDSSVCFMSAITFSQMANNVLLFSEGNDTVFRITPQRITPVYWLDRKNKSDYYTQVSDISKFRGSGDFPEGTINVYDLLETNDNLYLRVFDQENFYIVRFNNQTGEVTSHKIPQDYLDCSTDMPGVNVVGFDNDIDGGVPIWPEYASTNQGVCAQVVTFDIIDKMKSKGYLKELPEALNIGEDDNPVVILYTFKN